MNNAHPCEQHFGLSLQLAQHAVRFDVHSLPESAIAATQRAILDGIGVMLAASGESAEARAFVDLVLSQPGPPQASLLGFNVRASAAQAALVNGALAHALDYEDAFDLAPLHPNASLLPAALATAECSPCSGLQFIAAVALGCDLTCRLGLSLQRPLEVGGWYPPPILGAFGATLAAGRLARLDARALCDAWSLVLAQNSCPGEIKNSARTVLRAVREAFPAHAAVLSVQLAARGVRGFEAPFEGEAAFYALFAGGTFDSEAMLGGLGHRFWIEQLSYKRWPCCRGTHAYIEAIQTLKREQKFLPADIVRIVCAGGPIQQMLCEPHAQKRAPSTVIDAKFSIPFTAALALTHDEVTLESFTPSQMRNPELLQLAAQCEFQLNPQPYPAGAASGDVQLHLRDGRVLRHSIARALGEPSRPLDDDALREKFIDCASRAANPMTRTDALRFAERVLSLAQEPDSAAVFQALQCPTS